MIDLRKQNNIRDLRKLNKLAVSIKPSDSKETDFHLALADYLYKELKLEGLDVTRKSVVLNVRLKNISKSKYENIVIDCLDGTIFLRGEKVKDRYFGKLRRFEGTRASEAYHCVVQSAKRIINRIKELQNRLDDFEREIIAEVEVIDMRKKNIKVENACPNIKDLRKKAVKNKESKFKDLLQQINDINDLDKRFELIILASALAIELGYKIKMDIDNDKNAPIMSIKSPTDKMDLCMFNENFLWDLNPKFNKENFKNKKTLIKENIKGPNDGTYLASKMTTVTKDYLDEGPESWKAGAYDLTRTLEGTININYIKDFPGANGEVRQWNEYDGKKYFGNYTEERWNQFLKDISDNGIKEEILIFVEDDGNIVVAEGNHRIQAAIQLGINEVPVEIRYFGNSQKFQDYFDK